MTTITIQEQTKAILKQLREGGLTTPKLTEKLKVLTEYLDSLNLDINSTQDEINQIIELAKPLDMNKTQTHEVETIQPKIVNFEDKKLLVRDVNDLTLSIDPDSILPTIEVLNTEIITDDTVVIGYTVSETKQDETAPEVVTVTPEVVETISYTIADTLKSKDFNGTILGAKVKIIGSWEKVKNLLEDKIIFKVYFNNVWTITYVVENFVFKRADKELSSVSEKKMYSNLKTGDLQQQFIFDNLDTISHHAPLVGLYFNMLATSIDDNDSSSQTTKDITIGLNDLFVSCRKIENILQSKNTEYPVHFKVLTRYLRANTNY